MQSPSVQLSREPGGELSLSGDTECLRLKTKNPSEGYELHSRRKL